MVLHERAWSKSLAHLSSTRCGLMDHNTSSLLRVSPLPEAPETGSQPPRTQPGAQGRRVRSRLLFRCSAGKGGEGCELRALAEVLLQSPDCPLFPAGCQEHTQAKEILIHRSSSGTFRFLSETLSEEHHKVARQPFQRKSRPREAWLAHSRGAQLPRWGCRAFCSPQRLTGERQPRARALTSWKEE